MRFVFNEESEVKCTKKRHKTPHRGMRDTYFSHPLGRFARLHEPWSKNHDCFWQVLVTLGFTLRSLKASQGAPLLLLHVCLTGDGSTVCCYDRFLKYFLQEAVSQHLTLLKYKERCHFVQKVVFSTNWKTRLFICLMFLHFIEIAVNALLHSLILTHCLDKFKKIIQCKCDFYKSRQKNFLPSCIERVVWTIITDSSYTATILLSLHVLS